MYGHADFNCRGWKIPIFVEPLGNVAGKSVEGRIGNGLINVVFLEIGRTMFGYGSDQLLQEEGADVSLLMGNIEQVTLLFLEDRLFRHFNHRLQLVNPLHEDPQHFRTFDRHSRLSKFFRGVQWHVLLELHANSMLDLNQSYFQRVTDRLVEAKHISHDLLKGFIVILGLADQPVEKQFDTGCEIKPLHVIIVGNKSFLGHPYPWIEDYFKFFEHGVLPESNFILFCEEAAELLTDEGLASWGVLHDVVGQRFQ